MLPVFCRFCLDVLVAAPRMVHGVRAKLVHFLDEPYGQLFDLRADPEEMHNLWDSPAGAEAKVRLLAELREWHIRSQVRTAKWVEDWR